MTADRATALTTLERCVAYAACSELLASPHELDLRAALAPRIGPCAARTQTAALSEAARTLHEAEPDALRAEYSALFEVGDDGPPLPLRASLHPPRSQAALEEVVRFHEYFGYVVGPRHAWQPDHLSVLLEFMHWLCVREAASTEAGDVAGSAGLRRAQADFAERHLLSWLPALVAAAGTPSRATTYAAVLRAVLQFVEADAAALRNAPR